MAQHEVALLPSGTAGHLIPVPLPEMQLLGGFQLPRHLPLALASIIPLLLGTSGASWPSALCEVGLPHGQGRHSLGT